MSKISDLKQIENYLSSTSLFEKQKILNYLLINDLRLQNDIRDFYEKEYKKDKEKMKEFLIEEVKFEYEAMILVLTREKNILEKKLEDISEIYKIQQNNNQNLLQEKLTLIDQKLKEKDDMINSLNGKIEDLKLREEKTKKNLAFLRNEKARKNFNLFIDGRYEILSNEKIREFRNNIIDLEETIIEDMEEKIPGIEDITLSYELIKFIENNHKNKILSESLYKEIFEEILKMKVKVKVKEEEYYIHAKDLIKFTITDEENLYNVLNGRA